MRQATRFALFAVTVLLLGLCAVAPQGPATAQTNDKQTDNDPPNIVYILTDDMSADLLPYLAEVTQLRSEGTTLPNYVYADTLCCPSRATILSGRFPHNTGVRTNVSTQHNGGLGSFLDDEPETFAVALDDAGYRTGLMGKYMNEYSPAGANASWWYDYPPLYVPPGWDEWHVAGAAGYNEMNYSMTRSVDGAASHEVFRNRYLTDVLATKAKAFIHRADDQPFFLEIAPFAPHSQIGDNPKPYFVPAPRDRVDSKTGYGGDCGPQACVDVRAPRGPDFDENTADKPDWVRRAPLRDGEKDTIDDRFVLRVQMMQAVNDLIATVRTALAEAGEADNTYLVFGSDNGYHLGQHRLLSGKGTPYEHDLRVPLIVAGPRVPAGATSTELVQNVDMFATFHAMAGITPRRNDGREFLSAIHGERGTGTRQAAYMEHSAFPTQPSDDPDADTQRRNAHPGSYQALRTADELYVEYADGTVEYYDLAADPHQLRNQVESLSHSRLAALHRRLAAFATCGRPQEVNCWSAATRWH